MKIANIKSHKKIVVFLSTSVFVAVTGFFVFTSFVKATTIGSNISTTGTLSVSNDADFTLGASNRVLIDAATTDTTLTSGVVDLNVDIAANNASALDINLTSQGQYDMRGTVTTLTTGQAVTNKNAVGHRVVINGINDASSSGSYTGFFTRAEGSSNNAARYIGFEVGFSGGFGTSVDMTGTGNVDGFKAGLTKNAGSGDLRGINVDMNSTGTSTAVLIGQLMTLDASGASTTSANGIEISEDGASGTVGNAIFIYSNNSGSDGITDAIDVSDVEITNAINVGNNTILGNGSFSIDLLNASADTLTITNSNTGGSALASVAIEGSLTIGNGGTNPGTAITKHYSATGTAGNGGSTVTGSGCITDTITVNGAATGDVVNLGIPSDLEGYLIVFAYVSSANTVTIRICALGAGGNSADKTYRVDVWQH